MGPTTFKKPASLFPLLLYCDIYIYIFLAQIASSATTQSSSCFSCGSRSGEIVVMNAFTSGTMDSVLYSLKASLQRFRGERGFQRLLDAGRLTILSFLGEFEASQDAVFSKRAEAVMKTRQCLLDLNELFDTVDTINGTLVETFSRIIQTLEGFHKCCDVEAITRTEEAMMNERGEFEAKFQELRQQNAKLKESFLEFSTLKLTPKRMNHSAMEQVEQTFLDASRAVGASQTDLDVHRRRVQVREADLRRAQVSGDALETTIATRRLQEATRILEQAGTRHMDVVRRSMDNTKYALEQTSMASWSSSNVFFVQLGTLFNGFGESTKAIANTCCLIKNMQAVSKKISEEKGQALSDAQLAAARHVENNPPQPGPQQLTDLNQPRQPQNLALSSPYASAPAVYRCVHVSMYSAPVLCCTDRRTDFIRTGLMLPLLLLIEPQEWAISEFCDAVSIAL
eukprot:gene2312-1449_t